jgi:hypothetical protein
VWLAIRLTSGSFFGVGYATTSRKCRDKRTDFRNGVLSTRRSALLQPKSGNFVPRADRST